MKKAHDRRLSAILLLSAAALAGGCNAILGIDEAKSDTSGSSSSSGHGGATASSGAGGHGGMSASTSSSSSQGTGGGMPTCSDGMRNGTETDVDCGGSCPPCANTKMCGGVDANCVSMICVNNVCVPPAASCMNGMKDGKETDVDCGGSDCKPCADNKACAGNGDCLSLSCKNNVCAPATCLDGVKNGSETDIDCGGACPACADGKMCGGSDANCQSQKCTGGLCAPATCLDGLKNGGESDVDCGGGMCPPCANGKACAGLDANCASMICSNNVCVPPMASCMNGIKDGTETDIDCGGLSCQPCGTGKMCGGLNANCQSLHCVNNLCAAATCMDGLKNGAETGIDCGGGTCPACPNGQGCNGNSDCQSNLCSANLCVPMMMPTCMDGIKNGTETDIDCGGGLCPKCQVGQHCAAGTDCSSNVCMGGFCAPVMMQSCVDGIKNGTETDIDCGGGACPACVNGKACLVPSDCQSTYCDPTGHCAPPANPCMDGILDGNETDIDCGGGTCPPCLSGKSCNTGSDCLSGMCSFGSTTSSSTTVSSAGPGGGGSVTSSSTVSSAGPGGGGSVTSSSTISSSSAGPGSVTSSSVTSVTSSSSGLYDAGADAIIPLPPPPPPDFGKGFGTCL